MNTSNAPSSKRIRLHNRNRFPIPVLIIFAILATLAETRNWRRRYRPQQTIFSNDVNLNRRAQAAVLELTNRLFLPTGPWASDAPQRQPTRRTRSESDS